MPKGAGGGAEKRTVTDGMDIVMNAVSELEKIMEEIPPHFVPEFEEAAQAMIGAFKERASGHGRDAKRRKKGNKENPFQKMKEIQCWLRLKVPAEGVMPSEAILFGHEGTDFADFTAQNTQSVDAFLYEEDDVDELCDEGKLARSYCMKCGSRDIKDLNFISHSLSIRELEFIFTQALPEAKCELAKSCVVDVGSRLGGVLYAACFFASTKEAVGVELNPELCKVQEEALKIFGLRGRARVICDDVRNQLQVISDANVVVLHNVFQFFLEKKEAANAWSTLMRALRPGAFLVTCPPVEDQLATSCGKLFVQTLARYFSRGCRLISGGPVLPVLRATDVETATDLFKLLEPLHVDHPEATVDGDDCAGWCPGSVRVLRRSYLTF